MSLWGIMDRSCNLYLSVCQATVSWQNSDAFCAVLADFLTQIFFLLAFRQAVAEVLFACINTNKLLCAVALF